MDAWIEGRDKDRSEARVTSPRRSIAYRVNGRRERMIHSVLVINNLGKARLARFYYEQVPADRQLALIKSVFDIVSKRSDDVCCCFCDLPPDYFPPNSKLVYRHFATLYFIIVVDDAESELGILDLLQVFVQVLDSCFENVCELDLIYHFDKVNYILDEIVMGGMVLETNVDTILQAVNENKKHEQEGSFFGLDWMPKAVG